MPNIKMTEEEMKYIAFFESITGVTVIDCILDREKNRLIFLVKKGYVGKAVGKNGINIKRLNKLTGKNIEVVEYSEKMDELIKNSLFPASVQSIRLSKNINGKKVVYVSVPSKEKGLAIGKEGRNISRAILILKRYFDIEHIILQ
ncbi:MAG: NusA-like transcription termination signal-binding factor [Thermoprotei archaeon]|nr:MAG: NusA-like transcription termination signal-binding factor [Thermoprotei archaeon]RLE68436.1 MAG: NusA-like transcription termination signal-binding factor [Thermoprotei archaeon]